MGAARKARLAAAKHNLKLIQGGKRDETQPIPEPVPTTRVVDLHILVPQELRDKLEAAHQYVQNRFESRNDFLEACLREALLNFADALKEAIAKKKAQDDQGSIIVVGSTKDVVNMPPPPGGEAPNV